MRNLVFALILANLAFMAWDRWYGADAAAPPLRDREFGDILLASEFEAGNPPLELATVRIDDRPVEPPAEGGATDAPGGPAAAEPLVDTVEFVAAAETPPVATGIEPGGAPAAAPGAETTGGAGGDSGPATAPDAAAGFAANADVNANSNADAGLAANAAPGAAPGAATGGAPVCMSVGPFRELSQVTSAAANLRADGYEPRQRAGEGEIWSGYWVYLERIESVAAAQIMIESLHENGITDAYVIPNSDSGTLISLGVFSEIIRASRIREQVRQLGYDATIADRVRRATVYWVDVDLPRGVQLDFERLQPPGRIIRLEQRPCAEVEL